MNPLLNTTIEIIEEGKTSKGKYGLIKKLKAKNIETGQTNTWTIYETKSDGGISAAWTQYQSIGIGAVVSVGYAEQTGQLQDGTPYTSRIIRNFDKDLGNGRLNYVQHNPAPQAQSPRQEANLKRGEPSKEDDYWDKKAYKQCLWNYWLENKFSTKLDPNTLALVWDVFKQIEADADNRFNPKSNIKVNSAEVQSVLDEEPRLEEPPF